VWKSLTGEGYVVLREVDAPAAQQGARMIRRRIDLLGLGTSDRLPTVAVEVKVTRQDFVADVANPAKQDPWREHAVCHYFATPAGLIRPDQLPPGSGLLEIERWRTEADVEYDHVRIAVAAPCNDAAPTPDWLLWQIASRAAGAEAVLNRWATSGTPAADLNATILHLQAELERQRRRAEEYKAKAEAWKALAAKQGHKVPCATCGAPIVPVRVNAGAFTSWRHAQPHLTQSCTANLTGITPRGDDEP